MKPRGSPILGERVGSVCNRFHTPVHMLSYIQVQCCYTSVRQLHSNFGDFCHGPYDVMQTTITFVCMTSSLRTSHH